MRNLPEKIYTRKDVILERINVDDVEYIRKDVAEQMAKEWINIDELFPTKCSVLVKDKYGRCSVVDFSKCDDDDIDEYIHETSTTHWKQI